MLAFLTRPVHRFGRVNEKRTLLLDDSPDLASLYESVERRGPFPIVESCVSISESSSDSSLRSDSSTRFCFPFLRESLSDLNTLTLKKFCMTRPLILYFFCQWNVFQKLQSKIRGVQLTALASHEIPNYRNLASSYHWANTFRPSSVSPGIPPSSQGAHLVV